MASGEGRRAGLRSLTERLRDPVLLTELSQTLKTALAGAVAWFVATDLLGLDQPFLAPWSAVLVVHATVYRTFRRGAQQVAATVLAVVLAWLVGVTLGVSAVSIGLALVVAFLVGRHRWLRDEATTLATTAIVVLATTVVTRENLLFGRLLDTTVGIAVGLLVNLLVWPPLRDRAAWARASAIPAELAEVLRKIADEVHEELEPDDVEEWLRRCRDLVARIDAAWGLLRQAQESVRLNPRRRRRSAHASELVPVLHLLEQAVADMQGMARTVAISAGHANVWDPGFRARWVHLLAATADGVDDRDADRLQQVADELRDLAADLSTDGLAQDHWQEYGGLLVDLRNLVTALHNVVGRLPDGPGRHGPLARPGRAGQSFSTGA